MHIVIGFLVAVGTVLFALNRLQANGLDLNAFNPFTWFRRHKWKQKHGIKAIHAINNPMEVAAVFLVGIAMLDDELTIEQRDFIFSIFTDEFGVSDESAGELFASAAYMLKNETDISGQVRQIFAPTKSQFTLEMINSVIVYLNKVANFDSEASDFQRSLINSVEREFAVREQINSKWS